VRTRTGSLIGALLLTVAVPASAQQDAQAPAPKAAPAVAQQSPPVESAPPDVPHFGRIEFGFRGDSVTGDMARYNRFRDLRQGAFVDRFRLTKESESWIFLGEARNIGYRDQRFSGEFEAIGRMKAKFTWDQIPLFISGDTRSLQTNRGGGVLDIDDAIQRGIEDRTLTLNDVIPRATGFDMRSRRDVAAFDLTYTATKEVDFTLKLRNTERNGTHLQSFGLLNSPGGGIAQELGVPMDTRTTDVKAGVEYANRRGMVGAGVNASWFDNRIPTVQFDNPLRFTDISAGPARGLAVMWPSNSLVSFVANGAYKLPAKTRATAAISVGRANQNEPLASPTINSALVAPPLERASAEAHANVVSMVYGVNSRPSESIWLNARYRFYDYANRTPIFDTFALVGDWSTTTTPWETEPLSVRRHTLDLDASFTPMNYLAFGLGYGREDAERSYRIFENTAEDIFRISVDSTGNQYVTLRLKYEFSRRDGGVFNEHVLDEVDEQPDMRHFDIADRDRSRLTGLLTLAPLPWLSVNGSLGTGRDDYKHTGFGLRDNRNQTYGAGFDLMPVSTVSLGVSYDREKYTANQYSRTASPPPSTQFTDPTRDWWIDSNDTVKTLSASVDLLKTFPRTDVRLGYDLTDGKATYVYGLPPNSTVFVAPATLQQLPPLRNRITSGHADVQYFIRPQIALGAVYWYEAYRVSDFSLNSTTIDTLNIGTATIYSGYLYRPYTAHTGWLKISYLW
jgi:MtrB/PioB family decaheme-associated outer membrane protein